MISNNQTLTTLTTLTTTTGKQRQNILATSKTTTTTTEQQAQVIPINNIITINSTKKSNRNCYGRAPISTAKTKSSTLTTTDIKSIIGRNINNTKRSNNNDKINRIKQQVQKLLNTISSSG